MIFRILALCVFVWAGHSALHAQGLRTTPRPGVSLPVPAVAPTRAQQQADFIVAVVNSEPITNHQVRVEVQRLAQQIAQQRGASPDINQLAQQVFERLINERAQLQLAKESGIKVDEPSVDQAEQSVARQNQMELAELRRRLVQEGLDPKLFREQLRDQLTLTRLREREVDPRVRVSELEIEQYIQEQKALGDDASRQQLNLAQILVAIPDGASIAQMETVKARAEGVLARLRNGEDFAALVRQFSDAKDKASDGQLGLKSADRFPAAFVDATESIAVGGFSDLVRTAAGYHILRVLERNRAGLPPKTVTQSHVRHILLTPSAQQTEAAIRDKLSDFRRRILAGQSSFEALAKENSQDGSAAQGGDLGWTNPGQFVPEFEEALNRLVPKQISEPLSSRFGVHLIQLLERKTIALGEKEQREMIRNLLREKKFSEVSTSWAHDVRARAYVEVREPPL